MWIGYFLVDLRWVGSYMDSSEYFNYQLYSIALETSFKLRLSKINQTFRTKNVK